MLIVERISYAKLESSGKIFFCDACRTRSHLQEVRQSEEPRQNAHRDAVRALPAVDGVNALPLLLLHECHQGVHVAGAGVASEFSVSHVEDGWQGSDEETTGQARIIATKRKKTSSHVESSSFSRKSYTTSTLATFICKSPLHEPKSFQTGSRLLQAGHHGAKLENRTNGHH